MNENKKPQTNEDFKNEVKREIESNTNELIPNCLNIKRNRRIKWRNKLLNYLFGKWKSKSKARNIRNGGTNKWPQIGKLNTYKEY